MMLKNNEFGRSMIEMLGVLSIIGVISVGGIGVISSAMQSQRYTQVLSEISQLAEDGRRLVCDYSDDSDYANVAYGVFLYKSGRYPGGLVYDNGVYSGTLDITYNVATIDTTGAFSITIGNVPQELCIKILSNDWGTVRSSGITGVTYGEASLSMPVDLATAATKCVDGANSIKLSYAGCGN
jgi:type II secretory pathway pseudopilin PulG